ncbi:MAG: nucleotide exchange factor GrpE [Caldithrix sp.]|nr:nucleotide exchange factor GrpE [Caldithrix sp.]
MAKHKKAKQETEEKQTSMEMDEDQQSGPKDGKTDEETVELEAEEINEADKPDQKKKQDKKQDKKITELEEKIKKLEDENKQLKDQALRKMAELENFKRRKEKEFIDHLQFANESLIKDLLPALDDLERSLSHADEGNNKESLREGIQLIHKNLINALQRHGLKQMEAVGKEFDANLHDALMQVDSEEYDSGYVIEEHQKGYLLNEKVVRHAKVLVSK